ncbi:hypothetical protein RFI_33648, partial [Reticulomyxa filosa]
NNNNINNNANNNRHFNNNNNNSSNSNYNNYYNYNHNFNNITVTNKNPPNEESDSKTRNEIDTNPYEVTASPEPDSLKKAKYKDGIESIGLSDLEPDVAIATTLPNSEEDVEKKKEQDTRVMNATFNNP